MNKLERELLKSLNQALELAIKRRMETEKEAGKELEDFLNLTPFEAMKRSISVTIEKQAKDTATFKLCNQSFFLEFGAKENINPQPFHKGCVKRVYEDGELIQEIKWKNKETE